MAPTSSPEPDAAAWRRSLLLRVARASVAHGVEWGTPLPVDPLHYPEALREPRAAFVTLRREGALRGCVGSLEARRPLVVEVAENAFSAGFRDGRFPPLSAPELNDLELHIAVLGALERLPVASEAELLDRLRPGTDGLVLSDGLQRGTFLPSVWENLPEPLEFLRELKRKAGLPSNYWSETLRFDRYTVETIA